MSAFTASNSEAASGITSVRIAAPKLNPSGTVKPRRKCSRCGSASGGCGRGTSRSRNAAVEQEGPEGTETWKQTEIPFGLWATCSPKGVLVKIAFHRRNVCSPSPLPLFAPVPEFVFNKFVRGLCNARPHPGPPPRGEGETSSAVGETIPPVCRRSGASQAACCVETDCGRPCLIPSPRGRGSG